MAPTNNYGHKGASTGTIPVIIAVFVFLFLCVWMRAQTVKFNYEINSSVKTRDRLKTTNRTLEIKLQSMMSSEGIAKAAMEKYAFQTPKEGQIQHIKKSAGFFEKFFRSFSGRGGKI